MAKAFDVLGVGVVAVDDLFYVDSYPRPDSKTRAKRSERKCGGLTGAALVAAAKLGAKCAFGGLLGFDELSKVVEDDFVKHGVDVSGAVRREEAKPARAVVIVADADKSRTLVFDSSAPIGASPEGPSEELIAASRVLFVDNIGVEGGLRAVGIAHRHGIPVVADFEDEVGDLLDQIDHLILGETFALRITGESDPCSAARALWRDIREVVVTCGPLGAACASKESGGKVVQYPAFKVDAVDTTGCGDVFHGAYAYALAKSFPFDERLRIASAAAAIKAATGTTPTAGEVDHFLKERLA
jgi:sulfofructose kinase